jgi:hypothetical protein
MKRISSGTWFVVLAVFTGIAAACGSSGSSDSPSGGSDATVDGSDGGDDGGLTLRNIVSLEVLPGSATIDVNAKAKAEKTFVASAKFEDGSTGNVDATWTFDRPDLGAIATDGTLTANGSLGGHGTVTASYNGKTASAPVDIVLHFDINTAGVADADKSKFDAPDTTASGTMLYPYDQTVFPRGLLAPELMWSGGAKDDVYRVQLKGKYVDAKVYAKFDPPSRYPIDDAVWTPLTQSSGGDAVTLEVTRMTGAQAHAPMRETWTIANGSLRGSIYYWAVNTGQLMKIAPGAKTPAIVFDSGSADVLGTPAPAAYNGATPPWEKGTDGKRCVACHTVSKDGSTIAAVFERKGSTASPWGTINLTKTPATVEQITPYTSNTIYLALNPDGGLAIQNDVNFTMHLADAKTGAPIPSALDAFTDKVADPVFSPDGRLVAFSSQITGSYPVEFWRGDLDVIDFDPTTKAFSGRRTIVAAGSSAIAFPSFTPDSAWVVYQQGDYSRAKYGSNLVAHDDLYLADVAKAAGAIRLATASGESLEAKNQKLNYQPTVNPVSVGGYSWVVFVSPRDYGNAMQAPSTPGVENRKQLWVAAVDASPTPGKDPSHPGFWLPGQDLSTINMSGSWALEACRSNGTSCDQGYECCTGFCRPDGMGGATCVAPPSACSQTGDKCAKDGDCCETTNKCIGGFCALTIK